VGQLVTQPVAPVATDDALDPRGRSAPAAGALESSPPESSEARSAVSDPAHAPLPLVALVLGAAGVVLGVTVVWFFAAIPIGIAAVVTGMVARRRIGSYNDVRAASRATIATALGCVAILLGVTGAIFLPRVMDRADRFLGTIQQNVNNDVGLVNNSLNRDVDRLDLTLSRDLRRFERDNHRDLRDLEDRTAATLKALEDRMKGDVTAASAAARRDLTALETALRADLATAQRDLRTTDSSLSDSIAALEARVTRIERELGL
jgi:hypothetical protein